MTTTELTRLVLDAGAFKAEEIARDKIVTSASFRDMCRQNSCGKYGKCYMCPPDVGDIDLLIANLDRFSKGVLYQTVNPLEDSFDYEGMTDAANKHTALSYAIQAEVKKHFAGEVLHLTRGGCGLCKKCAKSDSQPCRFPDKALPSLESYGVDVYNTANNTTLKYINGQNTVTYFGLVMLSEYDN